MSPRPINPLWIDRFRFQLMPIAGEFFPSWLARLAVANGIEPSRLMRKLGSRTPNGTDLLHVPENRLDLVSLLAGVPVEALWMMTCLPELELTHYYPFTESKDRGDWVIPSPCSASERPGLAQVCIECLREDGIPFLRKSWRMAYLARCPLHRIPLIDRCPRCTTPLDPFVRRHLPVRGLGSNLFLRCSQCGYHLLSEDPPVLHTEPPSIQFSLQLTHQILRAIKEGWYPLSGFGPVPTPLFLGGLRVLLRILGSRFGMEWRMWISHQVSLGPSSAEDSSESHLRYFERLPGPNRERLLAEAACLLEEWPHRFLESVQAVGLRGTFILEQRARRLPFWLLSAIQDPLCRLRFPSAACPPIQSRYDTSGPGGMALLGRSNTFEKIGFIQDHPEWQGDLTQLATAMVDFGLFSPTHPTNSIIKSCKTHLKLITKHANSCRSPKEAITITGFRARLVAQRKFLKALKSYISGRLGL